MKNLKIFKLTILFSVLFSFMLSAQSLDKIKLTNNKDSVSYAIGMDIAVNLNSQSIEVNPEVMAKGLIDFLKQNKMMLTDEAKIKIIEDFQVEHTKKQEEMAQKKAEEILKQERNFSKTIRKDLELKLLNLVYNMK